VVPSCSSERVTATAQFKLGCHYSTVMGLSRTQELGSVVVPLCS